MPTTMFGAWEDCFKLLPYRDHEGRWRYPMKTQRRQLIVAGRSAWEYRERNQTAEEQAYWWW